MEIQILFISNVDYLQYSVSDSLQIPRHSALQVLRSLSDRAQVERVINYLYLDCLQNVYGYILLTVTVYGTALF